MNKKYQVFVSSTYEDLKSERDQVIKAVLEMGHIPVGMELFSAADEEQWKIIQRHIDESDYYVLVVAQKYGSVTKDGVSYTEMEYDYAVEKGVPVLGFILKDEASWPSNKFEKTQKKRKSLNEFKEKIKSRLVDFWSGVDELHAKVSISLMKTINTTPREGWVRASEVSNPEVTKELTRLSGENADLRAEIETLNKIIIQKPDEIREVFEILYKNEFNVKVRITSKWKDAKKYSCTLLDIFEATGPYLLDENSTSGMSNNIALSLYGTGYYKSYPVGKNIVSEWVADLAALDIIEPSKKKHSVNDKENYWSLTKFGKQLLKQVRRIRLEEGLAINVEN